MWGYRCFTSLSITERRLECISFLLNYLNGKQTFLPLDFLKRIAQWHYNLQKRATLSAQSQAMLAEIINQCIHLVQGTEQEKSFEDIRTQLLIQFDVAPTKDSQAIHTKKNHELADQIYHVWLNDFAATAELEKENVKKATTWLMDYIKKNKSIA